MLLVIEMKLAIVIGFQIFFLLLYINTQSHCLIIISKSLKFLDNRILNG